MIEKHPFVKFRSSIELVAEWRAVLAMPITQAVLLLMRENGPEFVRAPYGLTEVDIARRYGDVGGYARFYQALQDLAKPAPLDSIPLEETYEPERKPENA